jgi:hypothetical protein
MRMLRLVQMALEEASTGEAVKEVEHTLYARIEDFEILKNADEKEHQEQWEIKIPKTDENASKGTCRIRKTVVEAHDPEFVLTMKTPATDKEGRIEVAIPATEAMFAQFRMLSEFGMIKDRYTFKIEGTDLKWEVDMFYKKGAQVGSGDYEPWCKIDLEVVDLEAPLPPLPEGFADVIAAPYGKRSEAEEARVSALYKNEFLTVNPYL